MTMDCRDLRQTEQCRPLRVLTTEKQPGDKVLGNACKPARVVEHGERG